MPQLFAAAKVGDTFVAVVSILSLQKILIHFCGRKGVALAEKYSFAAASHCYQWEKKRILRQKDVAAAASLDLGHRSPMAHRRLGKKSIVCKTISEIFYEKHHAMLAMCMQQALFPPWKLTRVWKSLCILTICCLFQVSSFPLVG